MFFFQSEVTAFLGPFKNAVARVDVRHHGGNWPLQFFDGDQENFGLAMLTSRFKEIARNQISGKTWKTTSQNHKIIHIKPHSTHMRMMMRMMMMMMMMMMMSIDARRFMMHVQFNHLLRITGHMGLVDDPRFFPFDLLLKLRDAELVNLHVCSNALVH